MCLIQFILASLPALRPHSPLGEGSCFRVVGQTGNGNVLTLCVQQPIMYVKEEVFL